MIDRLFAIVRADFLIRFRRLSTLVVFLLLSFTPYLWVPDPSSGHAIFVADGKRALYTSGAMGVATATIGTLFVGLFGYYVVSNAIRRDLETRCGFVIASTPMRGGEYLFAKFAGNAAFLAVFMAGFMASSMAMLLVRAEAPLEPWTFLRQYLILTPSSIIFVSALAVTFESIPFLSGRFGDVAYFFLYLASLGGIAIVAVAGRNDAALYFDPAGLAYLFTELQRTLATENISIGATPFDASRGTFLFDGLMLRSEMVLPRVVSTLIPLPLLLVARLFFHRFDPARVREERPGTRGRWIGRLQMLVKPLTRPIASLQLALVGGAPTLLRTALADALLSFMIHPALTIAAIGFAIAGLAAPPAGLLRIALAVAALAIADIPCRGMRSGTAPLAYSAPRFDRHFVAVKLSSTLIVAALFVAVPALRLLVTDPAALLRLAVGLLFLAAAAVFFGIASANPKTFIVLFLTFWYVAINDKAATAALDFAGFLGKATPAVTLAYLAIAAACAIAAVSAHRMRKPL
ncbi:MAG TPA: hypothetical protein VIL97_01600 [Thermoanaerobaculia bacterium]